jgi:hypothetical protein
MSRTDGIDALAALAELGNLARGPIDFRPAQEAFVESPAGHVSKFEERPIVIAHDGVEPFGLIVGKLAHTLGGHLQEMLRPFRLVCEADTPELAAGEELTQRGGRMVDGVGREQFLRCAKTPVPASPRHHARHVVIDNLGDELVLAEEVDQHAEQRPRVRRPGKVPRVLGPVASGHVVNAQRRARLLGLRDQELSPLALGRFYLLCFPPGRAFRRPVKAMTSPPEIVVPERRARLAVEGHGTSLRV